MTIGQSWSDGKKITFSGNSNIRECIQGLDKKIVEYQCIVVNCATVNEKPMVPVKSSCT